MDKTVGLNDSRVRTVIGAVSGVVSILALVTDTIPEVLSPVLGLVAIIMLVTAYTGLCPIYSLIGFSTRKD